MEIINGNYHQHIVEPLAAVGATLIALDVKMHLLGLGWSVENVEAFDFREWLEIVYDQCEVEYVSPSFMKYGNHVSKKNAVLACYALSQSYRDDAMGVIFGPEAISVAPSIEHSTVDWLDDDEFQITSAIDGFCYLNICKTFHVQIAARIFGAYPTVAELARNVDHFDDQFCVTITKSDNVYHLVRDFSSYEVMTVKIFADMDQCAKVGAAASSSIEKKDSTSSLQDAIMKVVDLTSLNNLVQQDFTECKCQIHKKPVTSDSKFATQGCVLKKPGKANVFADACIGKRHICAADDPTRYNDRKFLRLILAGTQFSTLDGKARSNEIEALCSSSLSISAATFGTGYCYLELMFKDSWWRVARLLGPNPKLNDVIFVLIFVAKDVSKEFKLVKVKQGFYHFAVDKEAKGAKTIPFKRLVEQILNVIATDNDARVG